MTILCSKVLSALTGKTLVTAESCTGGMIGAALTGVPGASAIYKGGIISYTNQVKHDVLGVDLELLERFGAVSEPVAEAMALGARKALCADVAISVTGLAGPSGDEYGNPVGTIYIGFSSQTHSLVKKYLFIGSRESVREQAVRAALELILNNIESKL